MPQRSLRKFSTSVPPGFLVSPARLSLLSVFGLACVLSALAGRDAAAAVITFQTEAGRPRIASSTPLNRAGNVLASATLQVTFDQAMLASSININNIKLYDLK